MEEPKFCKKEYIDSCESCEFKNYNLVSHPGGSSVHSAESHYCELGYWEDDF